MGTFSKVTLGIGAITSDGQDLGYLKGDVSFQVNKDILDFKTGVPLTLQGSIVREFGMMIKAPFAEMFNTDAVTAMLGGQAADTTSASPVTRTMKAHTFADYYSGAVQALSLDGPNISTGGSAPVVKNAAEAVTYTENDDYIVDYTRGLVFRNPGGAIAEDATVHITYTYTPVSVKTYNMGVAGTFALNTSEIVFTHVNPQTNKFWKITFWKARVKGTLDMKFSESNFTINEVEFAALQDSTGHPSNPFGKIEIEQ